MNTFPGDRTPAFLHSMHAGLPKSSLPKVEPSPALKESEALGAGWGQD